MKKMLWILCAGIFCLTCSAVPAPSLIVKEKPKAKYENPYVHRYAETQTCQYHVRFRNSGYQLGETA